MLKKRAEEFVAQVKAQELLVEDFAVADEKKVLFAHTFIPREERNIYSHTKSFTSTAAGIAIAEGKLSLEDRVADFFPEKLPNNPAPTLFSITLKNLLTMSSGFGGFFMGEEDRRQGIGYPDFLAYMLSQPQKYAPGSRFCYNNGDTYLVSKMVEKAVGQTLQAYLYEKLLAPLEIGYPCFECDPQGNAFGFSGLYLSLTQMMKLGQLYLNDGVWKGVRLVESAWIKEATKKQIATEGGISWDRCGYGYQWWRLPQEGAYRADGKAGQITAVLPKSGLVVSVQCPETGDFNRVRPVFDDFLSSL